MLIKFSFLLYLFYFICIYNNIIIKYVNGETRTVGNGWCSFNNCEGASIFLSHGRGDIIRYCDSDGDFVSELSDKITVRIWAFEVEPQKIDILIQDEALNIIQQKAVLVDFIPHDFVFTFPNPIKHWISLRASTGNARVGWDLVFEDSKKVTIEETRKIKAKNCINFDNLGTMAPTPVPKHKYEQIQRELGMAIGLSITGSLILIALLTYKFKEYKKLQKKHKQLHDAYQLLIDHGNTLPVTSIDKDNISSSIRSESIELPSKQSSYDVAIT